VSDPSAYVQGLAAAVVEASRVQPGDSVAGFGPNTTGGTLIRPGGRQCYPAFWIRDFAMSLESGLIEPEEALHALMLTAGTQAAEDRRVPSGSLVPGGAIADHISFGSVPIFFPGVLDDAENQGGPRWPVPSLDDHYYFVEMAWHVVLATGRHELLRSTVDGILLIDRLERAFAVPPVDECTGLVTCGAQDRGVSFGFTDVVEHTGHLLFCSILRLQAARRMADLLQRLGATSDAERYAEIASRIETHLPRVFADTTGLLRASTGTSAQRDVWGTAFAVYVGALQGAVAEAACKALAHALKEGTIAWQGHIRHVPTDADFSSESAWESTVTACPKNRYQNGAYWATPLGWVCFAVAQVSEDAARELAQEFVDGLRPEDFRQGDEFGAPFECMHPEGDHRQNPVYMTSVTCPLAAFQRLGWLED
jgi:hypothetical protein